MINSGKIKIVLKNEAYCGYKIFTYYYRPVDGCYCIPNNNFNFFLAKAGEYKMLGAFEEGPFYNATSGTVQIRYTRGDLCGANKSAESIIRFICQPGK